jgi:hypothetical protein
MIDLLLTRTSVQTEYWDCPGLMREYSRLYPAIPTICSRRWCWRSRGLPRRSRRSSRRKCCSNPHPYLYQLNMRHSLSNSDTCSRDAYRRCKHRQQRSSWECILYLFSTITIPIIRSLSRMSTTYRISSLHRDTNDLSSPYRLQNTQRSSSTTLHQWKYTFLSTTFVTFSFFFFRT